MSDALRRAIRTFSWFVLAAIPVVPAGAALFEVSAELTTKIVAFLTVVGTALTALINMAEDKGIVPAFLKAPASEGENPVPNDAGYSDAVTVLVVLAIVLLILWAVGVIPG